MEQPFLHRAKDFRRMAWQSLKGVWGIAIVVALVAALLGASSSVALPTFRINVNVQDDQTMEQMAVLEQQLDELEAVGNPEDEQLVEHLRTFSLMSGKLQEIAANPLYQAYLRIALALSLVAFVIGGPIKVGYARFRLKIADGRRPLQFKDLFSGFDVFGDAFLLQLRITLRVVGWSLLFVIPGIIAIYRYSQAFNIMAEHPELGSGECIERSKAMMNGNKWRLFCLEFSYIGWAFLSALTLGILALWVNPYAAVAESFFYREVSGTLGAAQPQGGMYGQPEFYNAYDSNQRTDPWPQAQQSRQGSDEDFWKNY